MRVENSTMNFGLALGWTNCSVDLVLWALEVGNLLYGWNVKPSLKKYLANSNENPQSSLKRRNSDRNIRRKATWCKIWNYGLVSVSFGSLPVQNLELMGWNGIWNPPRQVLLDRFLFVQTATIHYNNIPLGSLISVSRRFMTTCYGEPNISGNVV